jgi:hypothetical protein
LCAGNPGAVVAACYYDSEVKGWREGAEDLLAERFYLALKGVTLGWPIFLHFASSIVCQFWDSLRCFGFLCLFAGPHHAVRMGIAIV